MHYYPVCILQHPLRVGSDIRTPYAEKPLLNNIKVGGTRQIRGRQTRWKCIIPCGFIFELDKIFYRVGLLGVCWKNMDVFPRDLEMCALGRNMCCACAGDLFGVDSKSIVYVSCHPDHVYVNANRNPCDITSNFKELVGIFAQHSQRALEGMWFYIESTRDCETHRCIATRYHTFWPVATPRDWSSIAAGPRHVAAASNVYFFCVGVPKRRKPP